MSERCESIGYFDNPYTCTRRKGHAGHHKNGVWRWRDGGLTDADFNGDDAGYPLPDQFDEDDGKTDFTVNDVQRNRQATSNRGSQTMTAADAAAILELFPKCAICGRVIADGEGFRQCDGRNRVCHSTCAGQSA